MRNIVCDFFVWKNTGVKISKEQLKELQEILQKEYGTTLSDECLLNEALRLFELAKTVLRFHLQKK